MIVEIYFPCFYGSEVSDTFGKISTSLFHSEWINEDKEFKSAMLIFMEKVKKPGKISIFGVYDVNLETFTFICNAAFSLYAVFKSRVN